MLKLYTNDIMYATKIYSIVTLNVRLSCIYVARSRLDRLIFFKLVIIYSYIFNHSILEY